MKKLIVAAAAVVLAAFAILPPVFSVSTPETLVAVSFEEPARKSIDLGDGIVVVEDCDDFVLALIDPGSRESLERPGLDVVELDRSPRTKDDYYVLETGSGLASGDTLPIGTAVLHRTDGRIVFRASPGEAIRVAAAFETAGSKIHGALRKIRLRPVFPVVERPLSDGRLVTSPDPQIQAMLTAISGASLQSRVQDLEDIGGRRYDSTGGQIAEDMVVAWFESFSTPENGLVVTTQAFQTGSHDNVIAVLPGAVSPDEQVIVGAHYDSICYSCSHPYGADDNATGTACVLEACRILSQYRFEKTIVFCTWGAEEIGLVGSDHYATLARQNGDDIYGYLNFDMNGYVKPGNARQYSIATNSTSASLNAELKAVRDTYLPLVPWVTGTLTAGSSDHASFTAQGFRAVFPFESFTDYSPYIHTDQDIIGPSVNDFVQVQRFAELGVAAVATWAVPFDGFSVQHEALGDTSDNETRRTASARVVATEGVQSVEIVWSNGGAGEVVVPMTPTGNPGEYAGDIPAQPHGVVVSYYIRAEDGIGNVETYPANAPTEQISYTMIPEEIYFFDDMENGTNGWTHQEIATQDDWMLGQPNQQGDNPYDPMTAYSGSNVWGNDLNPPGYQGNYADNVHNLLRSPSIDLSEASGSILRFRRWLSVEDGQYDHATVEINGTTLWQNPVGNDFVDTEWVSWSTDVSFLDGSPNAQIVFRLTSDSSVTFGGWNVDDVEIYAPGEPDELTADPSTPPLGATVHFTIRAPEAAGLAYELFASKKTTPGIWIDADRILPLREDGTYAKVNNLKDTGHPWLTEFRGTLDGNGESTAPALFIPNRERFSGARFFFSGLVRDGSLVVAVLPFVEVQIQ